MRKRFRIIDEPRFQLRCFSLTAFCWCLAVCLLCVPLSSCAGLRPDISIPGRSQRISDAPPRIVELATALEGASSEDSLRIVQSTFGEGNLNPHTFGAIVREWDIDGGALVYNSCYSDITFDSPRVTLDLRHNKSLTVQRALFGKYDMWVSPDDPRRGKGIWNDDTLGSLTLKPGRYQYAPPSSPKEIESFIIRHPSGQLEVAFPTGVTPETVLQEMPDNGNIARVTLVAGDSAQTYTVVSNRRVLTFTGPNAKAFDVTRAWWPR